MPILNKSRISSGKADGNFDDALNSDPKALWAAVGVAVAGIVGVLIGVLFVHRGYNRKVLLMTSSVGIAVIFSALGLFNILMPPGQLKNYCLIINEAPSVADGSDGPR